MKAKDIRKMSKNEMEKKLDELKLELIKARGNSSKVGGSKIKEIKKTIAKILTISKQKLETKKHNGNLS